VQDDKNAFCVVMALSAGAIPFQVAAHFFMVSAPALVTNIGEAKKPTAAKASKVVLMFMGDPFFAMEGYDGQQRAR